VQADDMELNAKMEELGKRLNLKPHTSGGIEKRTVSIESLTRSLY